jgi:hypothetical protein
VCDRLWVATPPPYPRCLCTLGGVLTHKHLPAAVAAAEYMVSMLCWSGCPGQPSSMHRHLRGRFCG